MKLLIHIIKYNPNKDPKPKYVSYTIDVDPKETLLDVLIKIQEDYDPTLVFNYSCRRGVCGSCTILVNGIPVIACQTLIENVVKTFGNEIFIEPLQSFRNVRDIAVDSSRIWSLLRMSRPWIHRYSPYIAPEYMQSEDAKIIQQFKKCISCLACLEICPVYRIANTRFRSPYVFRLHYRFCADPRDKQDRVSISVNDGLYLCLTCGACNSVCPQEIDIESAVLKLREHAYNQGLVPVRLMDSLDSIKDNSYSNPLWIPRDERGKWIQNLSPCNTAEILLYAGCMASYVDLESIQALAKILESISIKYVALAEDEYCCGMPLYLAGDIKGLRIQAEKNVKSILSKKPKIIITPCPSCYRMFIQIYPSILGIDLQKYGIRVLHSSQFLYELITKKYIEINRSLSISATYHDPCDLGRHLKIFDKPREVLKIIGIRIVEMKKNRIYAQCCGAGGNLRITDPVLSIKLGMMRLTHIPKGINTVVHTCPTCKIQFIDASKEAGLEIHNVSLQELVLKAMG